MQLRPEQPAETSDEHGVGEEYRTEFGDETADDLERAVQTPAVRGLDDSPDLLAAVARRDI